MNEIRTLGIPIWLLVLVLLIVSLLINLARTGWQELLITLLCVGAVLAILLGPNRG